MSVKKVTTFFRAGDHFGDQWIANKMGMIANMILNFPVFQAHVKNKVDQSSMCYLRVFNNYDVMKELLDLILPRDVLACFEVVKVCTTSARIDIYLDEKNIPPAEYSGQGVLSKGFTVPTSIQDFPLRGRAVYLHVRRRKWQLPSGDVVSNKFSLAADGTRYSREFASFLKGILG